MSIEMFKCAGGYNWTLEQLKKPTYNVSFEKAKKLLDDPENHLHLRIRTGKIYKLFGDLDHYSGKFSDFIDIFETFMKDTYDIDLSDENVSYTKNNKYADGLKSYHYVYPHIKVHVEDNKQIIEQFKEYLIDKEISIIEGKDNCFDTSIYSNHFFRLPNQKKGEIRGQISGIHEIKKGKIKDFLLDYDLDNVKLIELPKKEKKNKEVKKIKHDEPKTQEDKETVEEDEGITQKLKIMRILFNEKENIIKMIDNCFTKKIANDYDLWIKIGMALYNDFGEECFELWKHFSEKADKEKQATDEEIRRKIKSFKNDKDKKLTCATIHFYAKKANEPEYRKIICSTDININETTIAEMIKELQPNKFIWVQGEHYSFNGCYYVKDKFCTEFHNYIGDELYSLLKDIITEYFFEKPMFSVLRKQLLKLQTRKFQLDCQGIGLDKLTKNIIFDNNPDILPFNNIVYDLKKGEFRPFKQDDYITMTTGYEWVEPSKEDKTFIQKIMSQILPEEDVRTSVYQILSSGLDGHQVCKFVIFYGRGRNAKSFSNELLHTALGNNFGYLCEYKMLLPSREMRPNPEIKNMHKKRFCYAQEPDYKQQLSTAEIKRITGGNVNSRGCYENKTETILNETYIFECNDLPKLSGTIGIAERDRFIVVPFDSYFTEDESKVNQKDNIYLKNNYYKTPQFKEKYRCAFVSILMDSYKDYLKNGYNFAICDKIKMKTKDYLMIADDLGEHLDELIEGDIIIKTNNPKDSIDLKDIYMSLPENLKRNVSVRMFGELIKKNPFYGDFFRSGDKNINPPTRNRLVCHKLKEMND
jgi:hypothetical protein